MKRSTVVVASLGLGTAGYTWLGEPNWLDKVYIDLPLPQLPPSLNGMKLIQFSDVHLGMGKEASDLEKLADIIMAEKPDMICFTGDMVDDDPTPLRAGVSALQKMSAPLGKFAVLGNHDYLQDVLSVSTMIEQGGFKMLTNENVQIKQPDGTLAIIGLDDQLLGKPNVNKATTDIGKDACRILLMHEPDYADKIPINFGFHLQLSGHSHGGQIRLPWFGAVITPRGSRKYIMGWYQAGPQRQLPLYVNRGIGTSQVPIRFLCRPELTIFTLRRAEG